MNEKKPQLYRYVNARDRVHLTVSGCRVTDCLRLSDGGEENTTFSRDAEKTEGGDGFESPERYSADHIQDTSKVVMMCEVSLILIAGSSEPV